MGSGGMDNCFLIKMLARLSSNVPQILVAGETALKRNRNRTAIIGFRIHAGIAPEIIGA